MQIFLRVLLVCMLVATLTSNADEVAQAELVEVVLRPQMRPEPLTDAIGVIDTEALTSYFENIAIFNHEKEFQELPYIVGFDNQATMGATGDIAYSRRIKQDSNISAYTLLAPGKKIIDPDTKEVLGYFSDVIGNAEVIRWGETQTLRIVYSLTPIDPGIRLTPRIGLDLPAMLEVSFPVTHMAGRILQVDNDIIGVGHYAVAIISIGDRDGAQRGDLLNVLEAPAYARDPVTHKDVLLPAEVFGKLLVYKTFEKVSLAIVLESDKPIVKNDKVIGNPA